MGVNHKSAEWLVAQILSNHHKSTATYREVNFWHCFFFFFLTLVPRTQPALLSAGEVPRGEQTPYSGTDPESYITEYTLIYEEERLDLHASRKGAAPGGRRRRKKAERREGGYGGSIIGTRTQPALLSAGVVCAECW